MNEPQQFCTFFLDHLYFGVAVDRVQEVIRYQEMTRVPLAPDVVEGLINLRGQIVTAIDLRRRLEIAPRNSEEPPMNVVVRVPGGAVSLLVDQIGDVVEVSDDGLEPVPPTLRGLGRDLIRGACKLQDRLLLILDTDRTIHLGEAVYQDPA